MRRGSSGRLNGRSKGPQRAPARRVRPPQSNTIARARVAQDVSCASVVTASVIGENRERVWTRPTTPTDGRRRKLHERHVSGLSAHSDTRSARSETKYVAGC